MIETRSYKIDNRVFSIVDIKKLAFEFQQEYKKSVKKKHHSYLNIIIRCDDSSEYETEDVKLFENNTITSKRVKEITFRFKDYKENKGITLRLENGNSSYNNDLQISGTDSDWVNGSFVRFKEVIEGSEKQWMFVRKYSVPLMFIFSISIGLLLLVIIFFIFRVAILKPFINPVTLVFNEPAIGWFAFSFGIVPSMAIIDWFKKMFPSIEIQIGPSHSFIEANRRKVLFGLITLILIPLALAFLVR